MKKILHISNTDKMLHTFRFELLEALRDKGYEVHICASVLEPKFVDRFIQAGFVFHAIPIERGMNPINAWKTSGIIKKIIKKHDFSIIHTHTPTGGMVGRLAAIRANHNVVFHTTAGLYFHENMTKVKYNFFAAIERFLTKRTQVLFSPNFDDIETCKRLKIKPIDEIAYCGPAGVDINKYVPDEENIEKITYLKKNNLALDTVIIGIVARVEVEKGYKEFIDVIDRVNKDKNLNVIAISVGSGRDEDVVRSYAKEKGVDNIHFVGYSTNVPLYIKTFDILLFPSYREGLPIVTLEAMASQVPVVAFNIRGCRESIENNVTGFLVTFADVDALFLKTKTLIENKELREKMGVNGRKRVGDMFTRELHVTRQLPYYHKFDK